MLSSRRSALRKLLHFSTGLAFGLPGARALSQVAIQFNSTGSASFPSDDGSRWPSKRNGLIYHTTMLPNHKFGPFPNPGCPFPAQPVPTLLLVPEQPLPLPAPKPLNGWLFGVALNGVTFDPTGPYWENGTGDYWKNPPNPWTFEVMSTKVRPFLGLDASNAHLQPNGEYHYHGMPHELINLMGGMAAMRNPRSPVLIGWAADGHPIYYPVAPKDPWNPFSQLVEIRSSYRLRAGNRPNGPGGKHDGTMVEDYEYIPGFGDLDDTNGRWGVTPEFPTGTYHYFITHSFPFLPRAWRGEPHESFYHPHPGKGQDGVLPPALFGYRGEVK